ncbi:protein of unknown function [Saccharicrinis carchari]|uniref:Uncharacterized protein n=1 Tax=Saccharicrinis carchari TaxID=1168039 RepID=A0A521B6T5_SACCC|nr:DUF4625 domain-containing protein [Saccharicrinis carchari]SMO42721.1 protein of unknown function [Saccharicrinis carchari]
MRTELTRMLALVAVVTMFLTACGGDDNKEEPQPEPDTTAPTIETILPAASGQKYAITNPFLYSGTFKDNEELQAVEFTLTHTKTAAPATLKTSTGVDDDPWEPTKDKAFKISLSGKEQQFTEETLFGENIPKRVWTGTYVLNIKCTDKAGNIANSSVEIIIE